MRLKPGMILSGWGNTYKVLRTFYIQNVNCDIPLTYKKYYSLEHLKECYPSANFMLVSAPKEGKISGATLKGREMHRIFYDELSILPPNKTETQHISITCYPHKPKSSTYSFRGPINLSHLVNDCIKDSKSSFLTIAKTSAFVGISRQIGTTEFTKFKSRFNLLKHKEKSSSFYIYEIDKKEIGKVIPYLSKIEKIIKRVNRKIAKKIHQDKKAGKFSNQPETKVMVF